jgi:hypothetical protein
MPEMADAESKLEDRDHHLCLTNMIAHSDVAKPTSQLLSLQRRLAQWYSDDIKSGKWNQSFS